MTHSGACSFSVASGNHYKFTGKERDAESQFDEFGARYYADALGRFTIPDWSEKATAVPYANFGNPQSLNLYSFVQNNPTTTGDPDGHCADVCIVEAVVVGSVAVIALDIYANQLLERCR